MAELVGLTVEFAGKGAVQRLMLVSPCVMPCPEAVVAFGLESWYQDSVINVGHAGTSKAGAAVRGICRAMCKFDEL